MAAALSRPDVAALAGITMSQLDYMEKLGVTSTDVGNERKRYSAFESRLVVIAGRLLRTGIPASDIVEPVKWLRGAITYPEIGNPKSVTDIALAVEVERIRGISNPGEKPFAAMVEIIAANLYCAENADDFLAMDYAAMEATYLAAQKDEDARTRTATENAKVEADKLLRAKKEWDIDTFRQVEMCLNFDLAIRDKKNFFLQLAADDSGWEASIHTDLVQLSKREAWLVVDIRRLFKDRRI